MKGILTATVIGMSVLIVLAVRGGVAFAQAEPDYNPRYSHCQVFEGGVMRCIEADSPEFFAERQR